ncbi:MAG: cytochrome C oxidase subunit IV family protein [Ardenticatenales bacterium]|nr:cytochrome C oxidase subunit IV family protein [Ardenticatenales bacterium]
MAKQSNHEAHVGHVTSPTTYLIAAGALFVLTALTVGAAFVDLGPLNDLVALLIAGTKAAIIIVVFMHGRYTSGITRLAMVAGLIWLALLILGVMDDYLTRDWLMTPS